MEIESREKVKRLLRELFQFDSQDLDFGIYRIMNFKRDAIEKFIEKDLLEAAEAEFREFAKVGLGDLQSDVDRLRAEINRDFGVGTIDEQGRVVRHDGAPKIQQYLAKLKELENAQVTQVQIDDVFNHVYEFFSRYYDRGDFLSKRRYGGREKYYVPYNGEETLLHWATVDQYYVKTGEYFKRYSFRAGAYLVNFVLKEAEVDPNNVKGGNRYFLLHEEDAFRLDEANRELDIHFNYRELTNEERKRYGAGNVQNKITSSIVDELFSQLGDKGVGVELRKKPTGDEITFLEWHIKRYVTRNTTDYFIHKNLKPFLQREIEFYLKSEVLDLDEIEHMDERNTRLIKAKIRAIRGISDKIITFLAQIEDFQKKLFEKKKFILKTDYCLTLGLVPEKFYTTIGKNERQIANWKELYKLDETTKGTLQSSAGKKTLDERFLKSHKYLVLDTQFFSQEFKDELLETFENLDEKIEGILVKSENFQALNFLLPKYQERIKCIYIDPPYNTGSDEFLYKDNYQHSSWLSMMVHRMELARSLMREEGVFFVSIDDNEMQNLKYLGQTHIFGSDSFIGEVVWKTTTDNNPTQIAIEHEYVLSYAKNREKQGHWFAPNEKADLIMKKYRELNSRYGSNVNRIETELRDWMKTNRAALNGVLHFNCVDEKGVYSPQNPANPHPKGYVYDVIHPKTGKLCAIPTNGFRFPKETFEELVKAGDIEFGNDETVVPKPKKRLEISRDFLRSVYYEDNRMSVKALDEMFGHRIYENPKSPNLLRMLFRFCVEKDELVLDFFAGSGTTAHVVINQNALDSGQRKYILVEMADYFDTIMKPRLQKAMYSKDWQRGLPGSTEGISHIFKYMYLEQYEDSLNNIVFRSLDKSVQETLDSFGDYFVRYMLDYETRDSPTRLMLDKFQTPFDYKIKISKTGEKEEYASVDLVETFNYLLGLWVEKQRVFKDGERTYRVVFGKKDKDSVVVIWRNTKDLDLERDKKFIEETILAGYEPRTIYINGDSYVKNAQPIEPEFKRLMGA